MEAGTSDLLCVQFNFIYLLFRTFHRAKTILRQILWHKKNSGMFLVLRFKFGTNEKKKNCQFHLGQRRQRTRVD